VSPEEVLVVGFAPSGRVPWPVVGEMPPDVLVLRASAADLPEIAKHARLALARGPGGIDARGDEAAIDQLDDGGRLFVDGWRQSRDKGPRVGEGLAWDAPGFQPPDRPPS